MGGTDQGGGDTAGVVIATPGKKSEKPNQKLEPLRTQWTRRKSKKQILKTIPFKRYRNCSPEYAALLPVLKDGIKRMANGI
jgi:hypothetical protein